MSARKKLCIWLLSAAAGWAILIGTGRALSASARYVWGTL